MSYVHKIRTRDGRVADWLYRTYKAVQHFNISPVPGIHNLLALERRLRRSGGRWIKRKLYDEPLFRLSCRACGKHLRLYDGIPPVHGNLELYVGDYVTLHGTSTLAGAKVCERPRLTIGDHTHCGSQFTVSVGADVTIGREVLIANRVSLYAYDHHPVEPFSRRQGAPATAGSSRPIHIEDGVWICAGVTVLKGVTIGENSIIAAGSVVTEDVPPFVVAGGNPARVLRRIACRPEMPTLDSPV